MTLASFFAYVGVAALVICTPGPNTALTIRNTLLGGRAGGLLTAFGVATGLSIWALATSLGLVALLVASEPVFRAIQYVGAAYLIWLGVWRCARPSAGKGKPRLRRPSCCLRAG